MATFQTRKEINELGHCCSTAYVNDMQEVLQLLFALFIYVDQYWVNWDARHVCSLCVFHEESFYICQI